ncbi:MAG: NHLP leader peptide family RiPP precursor [Microbacterium sp.]
MAVTIDEVRRRAATDERFRAALLAEPRETLAAEGIEIPEQVSIRVVESTTEDVFIDLPPLSDRRLSEEELGALSGGFSFFPVPRVRYLGAGSDWNYLGTD